MKNLIKSPMDPIVVSVMAYGLYGMIVNHQYWCILPLLVMGFATIRQFRYVASLPRKSQVICHRAPYEKCR